MKKQIDARKLPCPQPLILLKKEVESGASDEIRITVDNQAARENLLKYARFVRLEILDKQENGGDITLTFRVPEDSSAARNPSGPEPECAEEPQIPLPSGSGKRNKTIFIRTDAIGPGNRELGLLLMRGFIFSLAENPGKVEALILMNDGVRLAVTGSESLENLQRLEKAGVSILVCGTCLDYLGLKAELKTGQISNMYEITEKFLAPAEVVTI